MIKKTIACFFILNILCALPALAYVDLTDSWTLANGNLLNLSEEAFSGNLCWRFEQYAEEGHQTALRRLRLSDGETAVDAVSPGYVIDKNAAEYSGALFAQEREDGSVSIIHRDWSAPDEVLLEWPAAPGALMDGNQTIRAFMNGYVYYLARTEDGLIHLCRIGADGDTHVYLYARDNIRIIDHYAISIDGKVAYTLIEEEEATGEWRVSLTIETPDGTRQSVTNLEGRIPGCMGWLTPDTLILVAENQEERVLMGIDAEGTIRPLETADGKTISVRQPPALGSNLAVSPDGRYVAYLAYVDTPFYDVYEDDDDGVPVILDLTTGKSGYIYDGGRSAGSALELRSDFGRISWYEP
ncbi:MAG: hypothetical protein Q4E13_08995 [Clostridia bacterium]|nr:hypothetical protein [Clostridia bacterium]